ncbi:hypothetical protein ACF3NA_02190 [Alkanindiges sp. WGS2144]|uniref:hypothetical protein n=1 Tax=Alkanindiges sp. WGS2144 TaxID=3366808 RepID=UPI00375313DD
MSTYSHIVIKSWKLLLYCVLLTACSNNEYKTSTTSNQISAQLESNQFASIDFSKLAGQQWTKVCFLGPYNENSAKVLGFNWQVSDHTPVLKSDSYNVIIFATDTKVIEYVTHRRDQGDFWQWSGQCLPRESATLIRDHQNGHWKNYK